MSQDYAADRPLSLRFNGYCKEFEEFVMTAYSKASECGCIVEAGLVNPNASNVGYFTDKMGNEFRNSFDFFTDAISKWLPQLNLQRRKKLTDAICTVFRQLKEQGKSDTVLQNYYVKLMCWLYTKFVSVLTQVASNRVPTVIYVGTYDIYRLRTMQVLNLYGCAIVYIDITTNEDSYKKCDPLDSCTTLCTYESTTAFPADWSLSKVVTAVNNKKLMQNVLGNRDVVKPVELDEAPNFFDLGTQACRLIVSGTDTRYANKLYDYRSTAMCLVGDTQPVRPDEITLKDRSFKSTDDCAMCLLKGVNFGAGALTTTFKYAFMETMQKFPSLNVQKCIGVFYICMRFKDVIKGGRLLWLNPVLSPTTQFVLSVLNYFDMQIVLLNPAKTGLSLDSYYAQELDNANAMSEFPTRRTADSIATVASRAESKIQDVLFNGELGIFKDNQFSSAKVVHLDCTFDEIDILWNEELRFRPGFDVVNSVVSLPTVYAVLNGIPDGKLQDYYALLRKLKQDSIVVTGEILFDKVPPVFAAECMTGLKLDFDKIMQHKGYRYAHLRTSVQYHMLNAAQQLFESGVIKGIGKHGIENDVVSVLLNLPPQFLTAIQNFDFTKRNPKLVNFRMSEVQMSLEDTVLTTYLSLLGFDVVFVVPTGYNVLSYYSTTPMFKCHEFGNYKYDLRLSEIDKTSLLDKMFRRK